MNKLIILCGIPFSGKTTLSNELVKRLGVIRIDLDEVKFDLFGKEVKDSEIDQNGWDKIYQEMYKKIEETLKGGGTVLQDTGNFTKYERGLVSEIAKNLDIEIKTIFVDTPVEVARERLLKNRQTKKRFDVSDEDFESTIAEMEPPTEDENPILFKTNSSAEELISNLKVQ